MRLWYSGVSRDRMVGTWLMVPQIHCEPASSGMRAYQQCLVVLAGSLVRVGAENLLARVVLVAGAPRRGCGRLVADASGRPDVRHLPRCVAAEIALVQPERLVLVEIL